MATLATLFTIAEFEALPNNGMRQELCEGRLIEMPPPKWLHTRLIHRIYKLLDEAADRPGRGEALIEAGYVLSREPPTVRVPDVSYASRAQIEATGDREWIDGAPVLAVEVVSPSDARNDVDDKVQEYLRAGATAVWIVDPGTSEIRVHRGPASDRVLRGDDLLTAPELNLAWSVPVARLFDF
jgi:Uma2 family endonuclease